MRGHIQQRGKTSWRVTAYVGRDECGTRRYVQQTVWGSRREAERELSRLLVEVDEGRRAAAAPITFGELLDRWLDVKRRLVDPKTIESFDWVARSYLRPAFAERNVSTLRPIDLDGLCSDLHGRGLSPRDGTDLPHRPPPVPRAGPAVGPRRQQPSGGRHAPAPASAGDHPAHRRAGSGAARGG